MAFTKDQLRSINIYNTENYSKGNPYIWYRPADNGRGGTFSAWMIRWPGHKFDSHWSDYGNLSFVVFGRNDKQEVFEKAKEKFKELFGSGELAKNPFGDWMDKKFVEERNAEIKKLLKEKKNGQ